jgi:hypothetical protein
MSNLYVARGVLSSDESDIAFGGLIPLVASQFIGTGHTLSFNVMGSIKMLKVMMRIIISIGGLVGEGRVPLQGM